MNDLLTPFPLKPINKLLNPKRVPKFEVDVGIGLVREMVDEDVEVDWMVWEVVGFGKGSEAAGEGVDAVKSEDFDSERKGWGGGGGGGSGGGRDIVGI